MFRRVGAIFLDMEKAFDRVWNNSLRYELLHMNTLALLLIGISSLIRYMTVKVRLLGTHSGKLLSTYEMNEMPKFNKASNVSQ